MREQYPLLSHEFNRQHKKAKYVGGSDLSDNISIVLRERHDYFNTALGNDRAPIQIAELASILKALDSKRKLAVYDKSFRRLVPIEHFMVPTTHRQIDAWDKFRGQKSFGGTIEELNCIWIDPQYHVYHTHIARAA